MERLLRQVPRTGHAARQGAQNAGAKEVEGHLRDHAGQGALSRLVERSTPNRLESAGRKAWRQHFAIQSRERHSPVDKTIGTPVLLLLLCA